MTLWWADVESGTLTKVDKSEDGEIHDRQLVVRDSRWLAYALPLETGFQKINSIPSTRAQVTSVTDGLNDDYSPAFDPEGKYLYFLSRRTSTPSSGTSS
jgi:tricorn protease